MRLAERRGLLRGTNLSLVQELALDFLGFLEEKEHLEREIKSARKFQELMVQVVKGAMVSSGSYKVEKVFEEHFPHDKDQQMGLLPTTEDADVNFDYGGVDFGVPDEDELAMLQQLLSNDTIRIDGELSAEEAPVAPPASPLDAGPGIEQIENDREWV